jgi:hypothetical protein
VSRDLSLLDCEVIKELLKEDTKLLAKIEKEIREKSEQEQAI